jgi:hypothetical protein
MRQEQAQKRRERSEGGGARAEGKWLARKICRREERDAVKRRREGRGRRRTVEENDRRQAKGREQEQRPRQQGSGNGSGGAEADTLAAPGLPAGRRRRSGRHA